MAEGTMRFELTAPDKELVQLDVQEAVVPGQAGVFTVYPGHTPLLSTLLPGVLVVEAEGGKTRFFAVQGGFAEVRDDALIVLADTYESGEEVDTERALAAEERAQDRMKKPPEDMDWDRAEASLARATARLRASAGQNYH